MLGWASMSYHHCHRAHSVATTMKSECNLNGCEQVHPQTTGFPLEANFS